MFNIFKKKKKTTLKRRPSVAKGKIEEFNITGGGNKKVTTKNRSVAKKSISSRLNKVVNSTKSKTAKIEVKKSVRKKTTRTSAKKKSSNKKVTTKKTTNYSPSYYDTP
jgi:hypothetical protein